MAREEKKKLERIDSLEIKKHFDFSRPHFCRNVLLWSKPPLSGKAASKRYHHTATLHEDCIYIFGGTDGTIFFNDLVILDLGGMGWKRPQIEGERGPEARCGHSAVIVEDHLYIFGGLSASDVYLSDLWSFHLTSHQWTLLSPINLSSPLSPKPKHKKPKLKSSKASSFTSTFTLSSKATDNGGERDLSPKISSSSFSKPPLSLPLSKQVDEKEKKDDEKYKRKEEKKEYAPKARAYHNMVHRSGSLMILGGEGYDDHHRPIIHHDLWSFHLRKRVWKKEEYEDYYGLSMASAIPLPADDILLLGGYSYRFHQLLKHPSPDPIYLRSRSFLVPSSSSIPKEVSGKMEIGNGRRGVEGVRIYGQGAARIHQNVIVYGGMMRSRMGAGRVNGKLLVYDIRDGSWASPVAQIPGPVPPPLFAPSLTLHSNSLILFGGISSPSPVGELNGEVYILLFQYSRLSISPSGNFHSLSQSIQALVEEKGYKLVEENDIEWGDQIGGGATAILQKARWNDKDLVVKRYFQNEEKAFFTELSALILLSPHPNILHCHGVMISSTDSSPCLLLDYYPLGDLSHLLHNSSDQNNSTRPPLKSFNQVLGIALGASRAVQHMHSHHMLHLDLKSLNLLITSHSPSSDGIVKLIDFGESRKLNEYYQPTQVGTVRWAAPEILRKEIPLPSADVYSLGVLLWELLSPQIPYHHLERDYEVEDAILEGTTPTIDEPFLVSCYPLYPPFVVPTYIRLVRSCWSPDPAVRPSASSVHTFLLDLLSKLSVYPISDWPFPADTSPEKRQRDIEMIKEEIDDMLRAHQSSLSLPPPRPDPALQRQLLSSLSRSVKRLSLFNTNVISRSLALESLNLPNEDDQTDGIDGEEESEVIEEEREYEKLLAILRTAQLDILTRYRAPIRHLALKYSSASSLNCGVGRENTPQTPFFHAACDRGDLFILKFILSLLLPSFNFDSPSLLSPTPLSPSRSSPCPSPRKVVVIDSKIEVNSTTDEEKGRQAVNERDREHRTGLDIAVKGGHYDCCLLLLRLPFLRVFTRNLFDETPLQLLLSNPPSTPNPLYIKLVRKLTRRSLLDLSLPSPDDDTFPPDEEIRFVSGIIHFTASTGNLPGLQGTFYAIKKCYRKIGKEFKVDQVNQWGGTPLYSAISGMYEDAALFLLHEGANPLFKVPYEDTFLTPLDLALSKSLMRFVEAAISSATPSLSPTPSPSPTPVDSPSRWQFTFPTMLREFGDSSPSSSQPFTRDRSRVVTSKYPF